MAASLDESARLAGGNRWVEARLFEVVGSWVPATPEADVMLLFDRHSRHHAWRAEQWWDRLPVLAGVDRAELCAPLSAAWPAGLDVLAAQPSGLGRAAALYRVVLPRLHTTYSDQRQSVGQMADGSTVRTLGIVLSDLVADWQEGEAVLEGLIDGPEAAFAAGSAAAEVEAALASGRSGAKGPLSGI